MPFIPLFSVVILYDLYFHETTLSINAGYEKFSFVFSKPDIFAIIALVN